jgi:CheY-like chemotaxis protein
VEDNPVNLLLVRELMALRPAMQLREAVDGADGLRQALDRPPDLLLLDLQLPDMPGLAVLERLRAEPALAGCRFVALSADAMPEHISEARAAGFHDYWTKPIDFERFLAGLDQVAADTAARRARR